MIKKTVNSILIVAAGLAILTGAVLAKDQIIENILPVIAPAENAAAEDAVPPPRTRFQLIVPIEKPSAEENPEAILPQSKQTTQFEGKVSAVDRNDKLFDLFMGESGVTAFYIDANTSFEGDLSAFNSLGPDMQVTITAVQKEDGNWYVVSLTYSGPVEKPGSSSSEEKPNEYYIGKNKLNVGGRVTTVGADTLTIQTKDGTPMTFGIGESTIISSYSGSHDSLDDIKVNFTVAVIYYEGDMLNGHRLAYRVVVSNEGIGFNPYQQGWVDSVSAGQFTITTNQGVSYTFMVNGSTQVKGVGSYAEIAAGMRAFVYFQDNGGTLVAKGIQVWP